MTIMNSRKSIAVLLCAAALTSCDYKKNAVQDITGTPPASAIRFFNFGINAPSVNFYANDTKMTAVSSSSCTTPPYSDACTTTGTESTGGVGYGGVGAGGFYSAIVPGQYTFTGRISATTDKDLAISNVQTALVDGKRYSYYQSGVYDATAKTVDAFVVEDPVVTPIDWEATRVRFVNAIYNANPMALYAKNQTTGTEYQIGAEVAYKSAGAVTPLPGGIYDLSTRYAGSTTNVLVRTGVGFAPGTVYTITARGDITVAQASTTTCGSTTRTCLDNTVNP